VKVAEAVLSRDSRQVLAVLDHVDLRHGLSPATPFYVALLRRARNEDAAVPLPLPFEEVADPETGSPKALVRAESSGIFLAHGGAGWNLLHARAWEARERQREPANLDPHEAAKLAEDDVKGKGED
jgi:hypothetical protein